MSLREKLVDMGNRRLAELQKKVRDETADVENFKRAWAIIKPILEAHPGWKWGDAVEWIRDNGLLPDDRVEPDLKSVLAKLKEEAAETETTAAE